MRAELCICAEVPQLPAVATGIRLITHRTESFRTTNSGRLAARCLPNAEILLYGERDSCLAPPWHELGGAACLFPGEESTVLDSEDPPHTLFIPDATWREANKMMRKLPWLGTMRRVCLPPGSPRLTRRLRKQRRPDELATAEAVAAAIGVIHGAGARDSILHAYRIMVERTLFTRGVLKAAEVYGGLPLL